MNFGAKRNKIFSDSALLPGRKAISRNALSLSASRIERFKPALNEAFEQGRVSLAVDFAKRFHDYIAVIAHFMDINSGTEWKMYSFPIGFSRCNEENKNSQNV